MGEDKTCGAMKWHSENYGEPCEFEWDHDGPHSFEPETIDIYIRWDANADSWIGQARILSIHRTLEGAMEAIPDNLKTKELERIVDKNFRDGIVYHCTYMYIEKRTIT